MAKRILTPNTTLYPVPVVLITTGGERPNVFTCNRLSSCSAEPPRIALSVRPQRYSHSLIHATREFVVNLPTPDQWALADYAGVVTGRQEDKFALTRLTLAPAQQLKTPLLADCPVNLECAVEQEIDLDSHTLFIGRVLAVHADESLLNTAGEVDLARARGLVYDSGTVRERPAHPFDLEAYRRFRLNQS